MLSGLPDSHTWSCLVAAATRIVWATLTTVGPGGVPRSRVLHPVWTEPDDDRRGEGPGSRVHGSLGADGRPTPARTVGVPRGWVLTRATPLKRAQVAAHAYASVTYWHPDQSTATAECHARWGPLEELDAAWRWARSLPAPYGYDPAAIWPHGPAGPQDCALLVLTPWRIRVATADQLRRGEATRWVSPDRPPP